MEKIVPYLIIGAVALVILIILIKNICIVQQSRAYVIERLRVLAGVGGRHPLQAALRRAHRPPRQPEGAGAGLSPAARYHEG